VAHFLFVVASTREAGHLGNTEWLAKQTAQNLPVDAEQTWLHLARMQLPAFTDLRHTVGSYQPPQGDLQTLLEATMRCTDLVLVAPVYWYSFPSPLKTYLDHWSAWMRIPGVPFKAEMAKKRLHLISTSGDRAQAQPMIDSTKLCAEFLSMNFAGVLWGKGGTPGSVQLDHAAIALAATFLCGASQTEA
jgi:NAD(P)H-dependent FMN reductase